MVDIVLDIFDRKMTVECECQLNDPSLLIINFRTRIRRALINRQDDADTDSHSDSEFIGDPNAEEILRSMGEDGQRNMKFNNLELLEKRFSSNICLR